ncbi:MULTISPECIES: acylphosphatase [unclassified Frankia]|uniref:acylphosphatase n=1 Tax=unclassified Frankia TaxID=2632575 RepID=UPI0009764A12|nr:MULTISPECIES: acylphosphatase [unclassified Frankia]
MNEIRATNGASSRDVVRLTARVEGLVQGVGFRDYVRTKGRRLGLAGSATNLPDGAVAVIAEGDRAACESLLDLLVTGHTPGRTDRVEHVWSEARGGLAGFLRR